MSIIHEALKKVQQGLSTKNGKAATPSPAPAAASDYIYANSNAVQDLGPLPSPGEAKQLSLKHKIVSVVIVGSALAIIGISLVYIYEQFKGNIPNIHLFDQKALIQYLPHENQPDQKAIPPEELKPIAQITINPTAGNAAGPAIGASPVTLNVRGILSTNTGNVVLINDQVYQTGDEVDGAKIIKIDLSSITVDINGKEQTIWVKN